MANKSANSKQNNDTLSGGQKAAATRSYNKEKQRRNRETRGIILIAVGILLAVYLFIASNGILGDFLTHILFGLFGWPAYILPILLVIIGILMIQGTRSENSSGFPDWIFAVAIWDIITIAQVARHPDTYKELQFFEYLTHSFEFSKSYRLGGGFVGAFMCYPLQHIGGSILVWILLIVILLLIVLMITKLSLKNLGEKIGETLHPASKNPEAEGAPAKTRHRLFITEPDENYIEEEFDNAYLPARKRKPKSELEGFEATAASIIENAKESRKLELQEEPLPFENVSSYTKPLKGATKKEPDPKDFWAVPAKKAPEKKKNSTSDPDTVMPEPFGGISTSFEVPDYLSDVSAKNDAVPGFIAEPPKRITPQHKAEKKTSEKTKSAAKSKKTQEDAAVVPKAAPSASTYVVPPFDLLNTPNGDSTSNESPMEKAKVLVETLNSFNIAAKVTDYSVGPVITRFELQPAPGVRVSKITGLSNDIALALAAPRVRIEAPIPGKAAVGIEIPNKTAIPVILREIVESKEFKKASSPITLAFGKDISGSVITSDLGKMPHLLIAGSTGSGKSVCINDLIISMVYKSSPEDLRMILIDPKVVELSPFNVLPHLLIPVVTEPKKAASALRWAVNEMMKRYNKFSEVGSRDLDRYNALMKQKNEECFPRLVVIIDELADLMMVAPDEVEDSICRIAQLGRAAGIHLIVATQRPSADIITGLIKANIPSRCAFAVSSGVDSRIILDTMGAEKLLGRGDMLFHPNGSNKPIRVQCAYVSDEEVERIVEFFESQQEGHSYDDAFVTEVTSVAKENASTGAQGQGKQEDELLGEAVRIVLESGSASISMIQRRLRVGYARAARLIDIMEQNGYVSGFEGSKPRKVLIKQSEYEQVFCGASPQADTSDGFEADDMNPFDTEAFDE